MSPDAKEYGFIFSFVLIELLFLEKQGMKPTLLVLHRKTRSENPENHSREKLLAQLFVGPTDLPTSAVSVADCLAENWERHSHLIPLPKTEGMPAPDRHLQINLFLVFLPASFLLFRSVVTSLLKLGKYSFTAVVTSRHRT